MFLWRRRGYFFFFSVVKKGVFNIFGENKISVVGNMLAFLKSWDRRYILFLMFMILVETFSAQIFHILASCFKNTK